MVVWGPGLGLLLKEQSVVEKDLREWWSASVLTGNFLGHIRIKSFQIDLSGILRICTLPRGHCNSRPVVGYGVVGGGPRPCNWQSRQGQQLTNTSTFFPTFLVE